MKGNRTNREGVMEKISVWLLLLFFWCIIAFQIFKVTVMVIICGILYTIINMYTCYKVLEKPKEIIEGFLIVELIPIFFVAIIALIQAII